MRTSIVGIASFHDLQKVIENTIAFAKTTHADPKYETLFEINSFFARCLASFIAVTTTIALVLQGREINDDLLTEVVKISEKVFEGNAELSSEFVQYVMKPSLNFLRLDEGGKIGYTYKTLGAAFYALTSG